MQEIIAEARHAYKSADGEMRPIWIYLRAPHELEEGSSWGCHCHIEGLLEKERQVCGEGSIQALCLALHYLRVNLRYYEAQGGTYYFAGDLSIPTKAEDLFGDNIPMPKVWKCEEAPSRD